MRTIETRKQIGFPEKKDDWIRASADFSEHSLRIAGHPIMEDWEQGYMEALANIATLNGGSILEVGYGLGLSTKAILAKNTTAYTVIECHPTVIEKCRADLSKQIKNGQATVLEGFWEDVTPTIPAETFDGILFDTYPLSEEEIHSNHFWFFKEAHRLLKPGGVLTYYSDEEKEFSKKHLEKLYGAGFQDKDISFEVCEVNPPKDCEYWRAKTIIAPIVRKSL